MRGVSGWFCPGLRLPRGPITTSFSSSCERAKNLGLSYLWLKHFYLWQGDLAMQVIGVAPRPPEAEGVKELPACRSRLVCLAGSRSLSLSASPCLLQSTTMSDCTHSFSTAVMVQVCCFFQTDRREGGDAHSSIIAGLFLAPTQRKRAKRTCRLIRHLRGFACLTCRICRWHRCFRAVHCPRWRTQRKHRYL